MPKTACVTQGATQPPFALVRLGFGRLGLGSGKPERHSAAAKCAPFRTCDARADRLLSNHRIAMTPTKPHSADPWTRMRSF